MNTQLDALFRDVVAERSILANIIAGNEENAQEAALRLNAGHFCKRSYQIIFGEISEMVNEGRKVDLVTLSDRLLRKKLSEDVGGLNEVSDLLNDRCWDLSTKTLELCERLETSLKARKIFEVATEMQLKISKGEDIASEVGIVENRMLEIFQDAPMSGNKSEIGFNDYVNILDMIKSGKRMSGISSGIEEWDHAFGGLNPGKYYIVAGRPGTGKTALACQIMNNLLQRNLGVLFFSLEMEPVDFYRVTGCQQTQISGNVLKYMTASEQQLDQLSRHAFKIKEKPMWIETPVGGNVNALRATIRRMAKQIKLIVVDYIQLIHPPKGMEDWRGTSYISKILRDTAKQTGIPMIVLSQLNRECERTEKPSMRNLRESGQLEQDADGILMLYNDKEKEENNVDMPVCFTVPKTRNGMIGDYYMNFNGQTQTFTTRKNP